MCLDTVTPLRRYAVTFTILLVRFMPIDEQVEDDNIIIILYYNKFILYI